MSQTATVYRAIQKRAKEHEGETVRFLADLVRTPSFSMKESAVAFHTAFVA